MCSSAKKLIRNSILIADSNANTELILREATQRIHAQFMFYETTLQIEVYDDEMEQCKDCTNPE